MFYHRVATCTILVFPVPNVMAIFRRRHHNGGAKCRRKSRFWTNIWLSDRWLLQCDQQLTVIGAVMYTISDERHSVYGTDRHASWVNTPKRREQNLFVRSGKSEAEVTSLIEECARRIALLKLQTDMKHRWFHNFMQNCTPVGSKRVDKQSCCYSMNLLTL